MARTFEAFGDRFAIAAGCRDAASAVADVLMAGGNVVDAAIAGSAVQCVVMPHMTALGGDLFALVKTRDAPVVAVNATGTAPRRATIDRFRALGHARIPNQGPLSVQTPGLVAGWQALANRWGSRPLGNLLSHATALAHDGFLPEAGLAKAAIQHPTLPIRVGEPFRQPGLARALEAIGNEGSRAFYSGWIARDLARTSQDLGGLLEEADLATVKADIAEPISVRWRGFEILTQPPISQGIVLLRVLTLLGDAPTPASIARAFERAFAERLTMLGDQGGSRRAAMAMLAGKVQPTAGPAEANAGTDTTALAVMDREGNAVALINSVFGHFGSGIVGRESGIVLNNRLSAFFLDPRHPNKLEPGRRTMHTLHTFMIQDGEGVRWAGGSPGGDNQPQINLHVLLNLLGHSRSPAEAIASPRWSVWPGTHPHEVGQPGRALCEDGVPDDVRSELEGAGFKPVPSAPLGSSKLVGFREGAVGAWTDDRRDADVVAM